MGLFWYSSYSAQQRVSSRICLSTGLFHGSLSYIYTCLFIYTGCSQPVHFEHRLEYAFLQVYCIALFSYIQMSLCICIRLFWMYTSLLTCSPMLHTPAMTPSSSILATWRVYRTLAAAHHRGRDLNSTLQVRLSCLNSYIQVSFRTYRSLFVH